ncbi:MAG: hypothetical protein ACYC4Q_05585 [Victivallaceae bacterium]
MFKKENWAIGISILAIVISGFATYDSHKALKLQETQTEINQKDYDLRRPYLTITSIPTSVNPKGDGEMIMGFLVLNSGEIAAENISLEYETFLRKPSNIENPQLPIRIGKAETSTITSKETIHILTDNIINDSRVHQIWREELILNVIVKLKYTKPGEKNQYKYQSKWQFVIVGPKEYKWVLI